VSLLKEKATNIYNFTFNQTKVSLKKNFVHNFQMLAQ